MAPTSSFDLHHQQLLPEMGGVPSTSWDWTRAAERGVFGFNSRDIKSRSFNLLRSRVLKLMSARGWKTLGIVSAAPAAGKSFISSNLAAALSREPTREVCLFDFDLRRSSIAQIFELERGAGLNAYLSGETRSLASVARRIGNEKLMVFPSFPSNEPSAELLSGTAMDKLMDGIRALPASTICIADLPPVFANDDAAIVAARLDAYLFVVEDGKTTKKQVRDSMNILAPAVCAGTVLNRYHRGIFSDDYGYGYADGGAYGDYYSEN